MQLLDHATDCHGIWQLQKHVVSCPWYYAAAGPRGTVSVLDSCRNTWLAVPGTMQLLDHVTDCLGTWQLQKHLVSCHWYHAAAGPHGGLSTALNIPSEPCGELFLVHIPESRVWWYIKKCLDHMLGCHRCKTIASQWRLSKNTTVAELRIELSVQLTEYS